MTTLNQLQAQIMFALVPSEKRFHSYKTKWVYFPRIGPKIAKHISLCTKISDESTRSVIAYLTQWGISGISRHTRCIPTHSHLPLTWMLSVFFCGRCFQFVVLPFVLFSAFSACPNLWLFSKSRAFMSPGWPLTKGLLSHNLSWKHQKDYSVQTFHLQSFCGDNHLSKVCTSALTVKEFSHDLFWTVSLSVWRWLYW